MDRIQIDAQISEAEIGEVRAGNSVTFTVDAYPDVAFVGEVSEFRLAPSSEQKHRHHTVVIDPPIRIENCILVRQRACASKLASESRRCEFPAKRLVYGILRLAKKGNPDLKTSLGGRRNGKAQARDIRLGLSDWRFTEILDGDLSEGDTVILPDSEHTSK